VSDYVDVTFFLGFEERERGKEGRKGR